jgi:hypothetical protein
MAVLDSNPEYRSSSRVCTSHTDFHPRNVVVVEGPCGIVELSGILDWEANSFYPEYWEQLKAMITRSIKDNSDWPDHLLPCILGYRDNCGVVVDRVIDKR